VKTLTSLENPLVKAVRRLQQRPDPQGDGSTVVEGWKLANETLDSGVDITQALVSAEPATQPEGRALLERLHAQDIPSATVDERVFRRCSSLESPEGVLLVARLPFRSPDELTGELVVLIAGVQDPGNVGAIARVAEAAGVSALVVTRGTAHPFQPKALRGSMGSLLRLPVVDGGDPVAAVRLLGKKGFTLAASVPRGGVDFRAAELGGRIAVVLGSESSGLPNELLEACDLLVSVPMQGHTDSLNVAVVAGLLLYEAARQRKAW